MYPVLIEALRDGSRYPHPVEAVQVLETHISWVLLTGPYAYKIKKPVVLEFLDFSSLERRRHFCDEELRLNRRTAPHLYLDVVPICGTPRTPRIGGEGRAIEFAVRMRQFAADAQLDRLHAAGRLGVEEMAAFGARTAAFHAAAALDREGRYGGPDALAKFAWQNLGALPRELPEPTVAGLKAWTRDALDRLWEGMVARQVAGFVRECHGDLHLSNLVKTDAGIFVSIWSTAVSYARRSRR